MILVIIANFSYFFNVMITFKAYAKINLGLRIVRKRGDGFHDIETIYHRVNLYDEIMIESSSSIVFISDDRSLPTDDRNLCVRAAKLLLKYNKMGKGANIFLKKNIPIGAGLGGGSSDAASTLLGLVKLWDVQITDDKLYSLALTLGSDVPYFLRPNTAYATGRGEILEYFSYNLPLWIVVVYPNIHISTAWAYNEIYSSDNSHIGKWKPESTLKQIVLDNLQNPESLNKLLHNDFEPVVLHKFREIAILKIALYASGASFVQMSGSGSAIFGLFSDESTAVSAAEKFRKDSKVSITPPYFKPEVG